MTDFTTVRSVGGLLPPDLLQRIVANDPDLGSLAPQEYGLAPSDRLGEAAARAWAKAKSHWASFRASTDDLPETDSGVTQTRDQWLLPLVRDLGFTPSFSAQADTVGNRRYPISHRDGPVPLHLVSFRQSLDHALPVASGQRRAAPHSVLQEYLNAAGAALYGVLSNGYVLRVLRDNASLTRQAYLEFDLQEMFEGGVYADFVLLFLVLHRTRLPRQGDEATQCTLERWRAKAESQGTRALDKLRDGVAAAIRVLGNGFIRHPANTTLRARLTDGQLDAGDYYRQLLRLVYRLIFLFAAEERDLIFEPGADARIKQLYRDLYSASRLRDVARRHIADDRHDDLWRALRLTFGLVSGKHSALGVPGLGGGLFEPEACSDLDPGLLRNGALAEAIQDLTWVRVDKVARRVSYRDLDAEELGGVYEGLLERQPHFSVADPDHIEFELVGGGERKQTGSYYTPTPLVQELVRSALEPVIYDRLGAARAHEDKRRALLSITVCDPACGSGHFLLAAARRLANDLARLDAADAEPTPEQTRLALREVIRHCLFGVDVNPLAVDLCKLALWLEGHEPGRPLTFLDHHVKLGNALLGTTWDLLAAGVPDDAFVPVLGDNPGHCKALKKQNRAQRMGQLTLAGALASQEAVLRSLATEMARIDSLPGDAAGQIAEQRQTYQIFDAAHLEPGRRTLNAWTAAFFWQLSLDMADPPTTAAFATAGADQPPTLSANQWVEVDRLREEFRFFHWPLEFPHVFNQGGFDCILGNPPWERIKLQEQEFFAERDPEIAKAPTKAARDRLIQSLKASDTGRWLYSEFQLAKRIAESASKFVRGSGRFPLTAVGDVNMYPLFAEHDRSILSDGGRAGIVVPTGIATDDSTKQFFGSVVESGGLLSIFDFQNHEGLFRGVGHGRFRFSLLSMSRSPAERGDLGFFLSEVSQIRDSRRRFQLAAADFALLNPNTRTCPAFRTNADASLTKSIYERIPVLVDEHAGTNPWGVEFVGMFHMSNDSGQFHDATGPGRVPLYEAKFFHQYNHRMGTYAGRHKDSEDSELPRSTNAQLSDPYYRVLARYWVDEVVVSARLANRWERKWLIAFRDIARAVDERTVIVAVLPRVATSNKAPLLLPSAEPRLAACLLGNLNSLVLDYSARQKVSGATLNFYLVKQFPVLPPAAFGDSDLDFIVPRVLELTYTAWDLKPFARDLGYHGPPFSWNGERRSQLRAELDAHFAALYGLTRDELHYVLDPEDLYGPDFPGETFRILREREMKQYGEYRTRRLVLESWDRLGLVPRNRDGRYNAGVPLVATAPQSAARIRAPHPLRPNDDDEEAVPLLSIQNVRERTRTQAQVVTLLSGREAPAAPTDPPFPLDRSQTGGTSRPPTPSQAHETSASPAAPSKPPSPSLAAAGSEMRERVLRQSLDTLQAVGPLSGREIAQRLFELDNRIDRHLVNSVLAREGGPHVIRDLATGKYRLKSR